MTTNLEKLVGPQDPDTLGFLAYKLNNAGPLGVALLAALLADAVAASGEAAALQDKVAGLELDQEASHRRIEELDALRVADLEALDAAAKQAGEWQHEKADLQRRMAELEKTELQRQAGG